MSQLDPLPRDLPFRIISKTIGRGAYASIKKAIPPTDTTPVFAVKFIHKAYAVKHGRISAKQIAMEVSLHSHIGQHPNIIEWFATGEDNIWKWIAMEYAEGGDLFDKIEADVGVSEDIAHLYFSQLISGVAYMHAKGVAHRDIKPENILLSESGSLKIADFGLATLFEYQGRTKLSTTMCGSPPYIAPEVITCSKSTQLRGGPKPAGYSANMCDIWSCGVVLFVLLVGNTPWDEPTDMSWEFQEFNGKRGHSEDDLWKRLPKSVLSLLRGMMNTDCTSRFNFTQIKAHPWFTRKNTLMSSSGKATDQITLATKMLEGLHIDFSQQPTASQRRRQSQDAMDFDSDNQPRFSFTQPEAPINDVMFDWERPPRVNAAAISASQPTSALHSNIPTASLDILADEPSMSQFAPTPSVPYSLTQHARRFRDIVPNYSLTRFFSHLSAPLLFQLLEGALHQLNIPIPPVGREGWIKIKTLDGRQCGLTGDIVVDPYAAGEVELWEVRFVKVKGDPLEWRRFFKNVTVLCKEGVYVPGG